MTITRSTGALAAAAALTVTGFAMPATANAQDGITVGEPGSAQVSTPSEIAQLCGTAYVGEHDQDAEIKPVDIPEGARAIAGLTVRLVSESDWNPFDQVVTTDANGRYCFTGSAEAGQPMPAGGHISIDEEQVATFNAIPENGNLTKTYQVPIFPEEQFMDSLAYAYEMGSAQFWKFDIAFDHTPPPAEPMGSVDSASLQFFNLPEILRGMLHGGNLGS